MILKQGILLFFLLWAGAVSYAAEPISIPLEPVELDATPKESGLINHFLQPDTEVADMNMSGMPMPHSQMQMSPSRQPGNMPVPGMTNSQTSVAQTGPMSQQDLMMIQMIRLGSGTAWQPLDNPMLMKMGHLGTWMTMLHGSTFADFDYQGGRRGGYKAVSENWIMGSGLRPIGKRGVLQLRSMFSAEPFTIGKNGYPLLFQTGEALHGKPLIDRQHPHDLFMEQSATYYHRVGNQTWLSLYAAAVGEPALGPVAYPHRYSHFLDPEAPLSHHMMDSTHVSFGVATVGLIHNKWQLEGSVFNGREPDDDRYDIDYKPWKTSASGRLSYMPNKHWAFQISSGFLNQPEQLETNNQERTTASVSYDKTWNTGWWASTLAWGHNFERGPDDNGVLLETTLNYKRKNYLFGKVENIQRHGLLQNNPSRSFNITAFSMGIARDLFYIKDFPLTLGAMITMFTKPDALDVHYSNFPITFHVFLHTNTPRMNMKQPSGKMKM